MLCKALRICSNILTVLVQAAFVLMLLSSCNSQSSNTNNISRTSALVDSSGSYVKNYGTNDNNELFVFVGEKISVELLPHKEGSMDNRFKAKYAILRKVYGSFPGDSIEFIAYNHYGTPAFSKYKNVLLYVSAERGTYYHQKYLYNDVYRTQDGRWAGLYASDDYEHPYNKHTTVKPIKIEFQDKVLFPTKIINEEGRQLELSYPEPYFKTVGDTAYAIYGNYIEDLFTLKKSGVLTSRGLFEASAQQEEDLVESMQPEPSDAFPNGAESKFVSFWTHFVASLKEPGLRKFREIALDTLYVCDELLPTGKFSEKCFNEVIDEEVLKRIVDRTKLEYTTRQVEIYNLLTSQVKKEIRKVGDGYQIRQMLVTRSTKNNNPPTIYFGFIESKKRFRLYEISHYSFKECCQ